MSEMTLGVKWSQVQILSARHTKRVSGLARHAAGITSSNHDDMHAGELETSILLAAQPAYLRDGWERSDHTASDRRYLATLGVSAYSTSGVIGYPSRANAEKGHMVLDHLGQAPGKLITLLTDRQT